MSLERANGRRGYPRSIPAWVVDMINSERIARGEEKLGITGKHSSELRGKAARDAAFYERELRQESAIERVRRIGRANAARRGGR